MKLSELVENVYSTDEEVIITKNGRPAAVPGGALKSLRAGKKRWTLRRMLS